MNKYRLNVKRTIGKKFDLHNKILNRSINRNIKNNQMKIKVFGEQGLLNVENKRNPKINQTKVSVRGEYGLLNVEGKNIPKKEIKKSFVAKPVIFSTTKKIPKRMFFYWGGSNLSWMRYMTIYSFKKMNPDWNVILYISNNSKNKSWKGVSGSEGTEEQDYFKYNGKDYFNKLKELNIKIEKAEFPEEIKNQLKNISPIHESDLFRYYQLFVGGGFYCDMDVLFFRPIDNFYNEIVNGEYDTIINENKGINNVDWSLTIGFLGSSINNNFFKDLFEFGVNNYNEDTYQSMGVHLIYKMFNSSLYNHIWNEITNKYSYLKFYNLPMTLIYKFDFTQIEYCFANSIEINQFNSDSIGYHWYGGHIVAQKFNNILNEKNYKNQKITFSAIADEVLNMKIVERKKRNIKISIVIAYFNRKKQFYETLKSIAKSKFEDFEVVVIDDCSSSEHRLEEYLNEFSFLKIIRLEKENKWYINPCIPFNIGIHASIGDIIILQNPECLHIHDILSYINENIDDSKYISISAYSLDEKLTEEALKYCDNNTLIEYFKTLPQQPTTGNLGVGWYNHSQYRPTNFHFCSAITRLNIEKLNGFDERFAKGIGFDDNNFIDRINILGLKLIINDNISVIHQYHPDVYYVMPNTAQLQERNRLLYYGVTRLEANYKANN